MSRMREAKKLVDRSLWAVIAPKEITIVLPAKYMRKHLSPDQIDGLIMELLGVADRRIRSMKSLCRRQSEERSSISSRA